MISRKLAGVSAASVGAATATTALLLGTVSGTAAEEQVSSAYGIASQGLIPIEPTPFVQSTDGTLQEDSLLGDGIDEGQLFVDALIVSAEDARASAQVLGVDLGDDGLALGNEVGDDGGLSIEVLTTTCENGQGDVEIVGSFGDEQLPADPAEGETLDASPLLAIEFNRQTRNDDGTLTVEGLVVTLLPIDENDTFSSSDYSQLRDVLPSGMDLPAADSAEAPDTGGELLGLLEQEGLELPTQDEPLLRLVLTSATCGEKDEDEVVPTAPVPTPTTTNLPVTH